MGGPEVLAYREMLVRVARAVHRRLYVRPVPLLTPRLSSAWLISGAILADRLAPSAGGVLPLGRRAVLPPLLVAVAACAFFAACSLLVRLVPPVQHALTTVLGHARSGSMVLVLAVAALNGAAEEVYFRGVLCQTVARTNPVLVTTTGSRW